MKYWQAWSKAQALTNGVQLSREKIQTWNQDIESEDIYDEVGDDDQDQCIVATAKNSTTEAIEAFIKVIAWRENNISDINDILALRKCRCKSYRNPLKQKKYKKYNRLLSCTLIIKKLIKNKNLIQ